MTRVELSISGGDSGIERARICPGFLYRAAARRTLFFTVKDRFLHAAVLKERTLPPWFEETSSSDVKKVESLEKST
jgi:hypothetical protein